MRNVLQNPQTNTVVQVGTIDQFSKKCKMKVNTQTLQIRVIDKLTNKPLVGAHIANISNIGKGTVTDKNGYFLYRNLGLKTKLDKIRISYVGYTPITIDATSLLSIKAIYLNIQVENLPEVTLSPKKEPKIAPAPAPQPNNPNITVQPSLNEKVKNSASWIWIALAVITAGGIYYYSKKK
ncbi:carboxypeptidase-like regulatory domain-containing protein [Capnocytophaga sputigena]|uniref:carboxypeptidase-like regulatory domain-containing protein n=1 Tax=Capnocytophaga sputigena TaxID=1019 RepID=UPI00241C7073